MLKRLRAFTHHVGQVMAFNSLPANERVLTFYSEGRNYWPFLGGLMKEVLNCSDLSVCYVCSSADDPGMQIEHPRLRTFLIDEKSVRDWFFANANTSVMVMTMPDLGNYQVKRSRHNVHYIYVQHSLVSQHMVYRPGAMDHFDTIFCAGPHHLHELRALEKIGGLKPKRLFEHGYARVDTLRAAATRTSKKIPTASPIHYLLAPSWGENGTIESGLGLRVVDRLLSAGHRVTLRPHPQTLIFHKTAVDKILGAFGASERFAFEGSVDGHSSLLASDAMISDWSGAALDYAYGLGKPVVFLDVPRKVNNPDYAAVPLQPFEVGVRERIGAVIDPYALEMLDEISLEPVSFETASRDVFNIGQSDEVGARELVRIAAAIGAPAS